jgi:hypothetical protein
LGAQHGSQVLRMLRQLAYSLGYLDPNKNILQEFLPRGKPMKSKILKAIFALALISPLLAHAEKYVFNFKANPGADGGGSLSADNDIDFKLLVDTSIAPSVSLSNLNKSQHWKSGGFILEMTHDGKTVRLNDAIVSATGALQLGSGGFVEIRANIDDFFDVDFHPGAPFVEANELSYDAFV